MMKIINLKLRVLFEYQNIKTFLQKSVSNWSEENLLLQNLKMLLVILETKKLLECFMNKNCKKQIKRTLIKRKDDKLYVKWKGYDDFF